jgi:hypothetical protein
VLFRKTKNDEERITKRIVNFLNFNKGQPYFIQFRVPLSDVKSMTDDEIKKLK